MEYTTEVIDRRTGDLVTQSLGEWKTVSELAREYDVGKNEFRHVLTAMGLLYPEGRTGRRRLTPEAVRRGLGKRIEPGRTAKFKFPFDVISPAGQAVIAGRWPSTRQAVTRAKREQSQVACAAEQLAQFEAIRSGPMTQQMRVCWLLDHFPDMTNSAVAEVIQATRQLVDRYSRIRSDQREFLKRQVIALSDGEAVQTASSLGDRPA